MKHGRSALVTFLEHRSSFCYVQPAETVGKLFADMPGMTFLSRTAGLVLVVCAMSLCVAAQEDSGSGAASKILAMETAWDRAVENKDIRVLDAIFDNGLVYVEYDGTLLTKAELLARIKGGDTHPQQIVAQPMTVRVFGSAAIVIAYGFSGNR